MSAMEYIVTYLTFCPDGSHSRPMKALCPSDEVAKYSYEFAEAMITESQRRKETKAVG